MKAKVLDFQTWRDKMRKKISPEFKLFFKHRKLIANAARRGYSAKAIAALVKSAEASGR